MASLEEMGSIDVEMPDASDNSRISSSYSGADAFANMDVAIKTEDDQALDNDSDDAALTLRNLQVDSDNRDSPNSSLTSASILTSSGHSKSPAHTNSPPRNAASIEASSPYMYSKSSTFRARSSIPTRLPPTEYGRQCVLAAQASRLNPYALHEDEHKLLRDRLCHSHVTVYLNIRNGILRLWVRNPNVSVSLEEAIGCVRDERWTRLACFAYEWLVRGGYINFGCVEPPLTTNSTKGRRKDSHRETIVVIGGGMAGLSSARQLTSLFRHYPDHTPPRIIVLEGRNRIGGRIYSHPLSSMRSNILNKEQRPTAEMGAHIIVGFEHGNPLDAIIRGQLALDYHSLRDLSTLYDIDGTPVPEKNDTMVERLYNDVLERSEHYRQKNVLQKTAEGDRDAVDSGRDPPAEDDSITIRQYEEATASGTIHLLLPKKSRRRGAGHKAAKTDKPEEEAETDMDSKVQLSAARAAQEFGFFVRGNTSMDETLKLDDLAMQSNASLGAVMNEGIHQYQKFLELKPYAMRLLNWHFANLEYSNAATVDKLSLSGWDQDAGYEFEGEHAQIIGGYQQVPRALCRFPEPLDIRTNKPVTHIRYSSADPYGLATITCEDGEVIKADRVILTAPLGVLKDGSINFEPALPDWKEGAISRMGFGLLNKLVLVFEKPFWDVDRDMFGLLRPHRTGNGFKQEDYEASRGQFYLFWNCIKTSGLPVLIALMAGHAAHEAEQSPDSVLVNQCMDQLRKVFGSDNVTTPLESIVTRWKSDRFARGTYSFVAAETQPGDYDLLAKPIDNLHFAGEATCGTHLATVHGAYFSGLRVASEVFEAMIGPIQIPPTMVPSALRPKLPSADLTLVESHMAQAPKRKGDPIIPAGTFTRPVKEHDNSLLEAYDAAMWVRIYDDLGPPPVKPPKSNVNPFLLFQSEHWNAVKERLESAKNNKAKRTKATRDRVRVELGDMWKALSEEDSARYKDETKKHREANDVALKEWSDKAAEWDRRTWEVKDVWVKEGNSFEEFCERKRLEDATMEQDGAL